MCSILIFCFGIKRFFNCNACLWSTTSAQRWILYDFVFQRCNRVPSLNISLMIWHPAEVNLGVISVKYAGIFNIRITLILSPGKSCLWRKISACSRHVTSDLLRFIHKIWSAISLTITSRPQMRLVFNHSTVLVFDLPFLSVDLCFNDSLFAVLLFRMDVINSFRKLYSLLDNLTLSSDQRSLQIGFIFCQEYFFISVVHNLRILTYKFSSLIYQWLDILHRTDWNIRS